MLQCSAAALAATKETKFILNGIDQLLTNTIHENPTERYACAKALELAATKRHFEPVVERFLATTRGKLEKNDSTMMKVIFGSAMTEKENFKCTAFLSTRRLFDVMVVRGDFKHYLKVTQFLIDANLHAELSTWKAYFEALSACSRASKASGIEFMGRNQTLALLCKDILSHQAYQPLQSQVLLTLSEMILSTPKLTQTEGGEIIRFGLSISGSGSFPSGYLASLTQLFKSCLTLDPCQSNLFNLLMTVHSWLCSFSRYNRQAGLHIWLSLLTAYVDVKQEGEVFTFTNELLSTVAVRCADSDLVVRRTALECTTTLIELNNDKNPITTELKAKLLSMETEELYDGVAQLGVILTDIVEFGFTFATR